MSRLLLDTTFLVDAERGGVDLDATIAEDDDVAIAAITVAELLVGVGLASSRHVSSRQAYLDGILATIPVLNYDQKVAAAHAELLVEVHRAGRPRGAHDLIIAATARSTDRVVVTADAAALGELSGVEIRAHR